MSGLTLLVVYGLDACSAEMGHLAITPGGEQSTVGSVSYVETQGYLQSMMERQDTVGIKESTWDTK